MLFSRFSTSSLSRTLVLSALLLPLAAAAPLVTPAAHAQGGAKMAGKLAPPPPEVTLFNDALRATKAGNAALAEKTYRKLLAMEPTVLTRAAVWANLSLLAAHSGRNAEAISDMKKATTLDPKTVAFWEQLTNLQLRANLWPDVAVSAKKTLALAPGNRNATAALGIALMGTEKWAEALPHLRKRYTLPGEPAGQGDFRLIYALSKAGKDAEADTVANALVAKSPRDPNLQIMLAQIAVSRKNFAGAQKSFEKAFALAPEKNVSAGINAAVAADQQGHSDEAIAILKRVAQAVPGDPRPHFELGQRYYGDNRQPLVERCKKAEAEFAVARLRDPQNVVYMTQLGYSVMLQGAERLSEAGNIFLAALSVDKNAAPARMGLAYVFEQKNEVANALVQYRAILSQSKSENADTYKARRRLAGVLYVSGKKDEAYKEFDELAARFPKDTVALSEQASLLFSDKRFPQAQKAYTEVLIRTPTDAQARVGLGQVFTQMKEPQKAQQQYERALAADPKNGTAALLLGSSLTEQKKPEQAITVYQKLLDVDPENNPVRWQLASDFQQAGKWDEAQKQMEAIKLRRDDPNRTAYVLGMPRLLIARKKYPEAVAQLTRLARENPKDDAFKYELAGAQQKAEQWTQAEQTLQSLANRPTPNFVETIRPRLALAGLYEEQKKWDLAGREYEDILRGEPMQTQARIGLSRVRDDEKKPEAAVAFLESLVLFNPTKPNMAALSAVQMQYQQARTPEKYTAFVRRVTEKYPQNPLALRALVSALQAEPTGAKKDEMADLWRRIALVDTKESDAQFQLGAALESAGKVPDAITAYTTAYKNNTQDFAALAALRRLNAPIPTTAAATSGPPAPR